jgi:predicted nucleic-acid-binding Zn-ribbon protein
MLFYETFLNFFLIFEKIQIFFLLKFLKKFYYFFFRTKFLIKKRRLILSEFEEKVMEMLKKIDEKLDKVLETGSKAPAPQPTPPATSAASSTSTPAPSTVKPSELVEKQQEEEKMKEKPSVEGRRVCPKCGGTSFNTEEDKSNVLHQMGGMKIYAKKYICKSCGAEV